MASERAWSVDGNDLLLSVKVVPGASAEDISRAGDCVRVRLTVHAQDGKANKRLSQMLGKCFGVPQSAIVIERGHNARTKTIRVRSPRQQPDFLAP